MKKPMQEIADFLWHVATRGTDTKDRETALALHTDAVHIQNHLAPLLDEARHVIEAYRGKRPWPPPRSLNVCADELCARLAAAQEQNNEEPESVSTGSGDGTRAPSRDTPNPLPGSSPPQPAGFVLLAYRWDENVEGERDELIVNGRVAATVWHNGVWHTWDRDGEGGENDAERTVEEAKRQAFASVVMQHHHDAPQPAPEDDAAVVERVARAIAGLDLDDDSDCLAVALAMYYEWHYKRPDPDPDDEDLEWGAWVIERANAASKRIALAALRAAREADAPSRCPVTGRAHEWITLAFGATRCAICGTPAREEQR